MEIYVTNMMDTTNYTKNQRPKVVIKCSDEEIKTLRDAANICDSLRYTFDTLEIFDGKVPGTCYDKLLEISDLLEDYRIGDKCDVN